jgi:hypothetical protein
MSKREDSPAGDVIDVMALALELAGLFAGDELEAADRALDDARRLLWYRFFGNAESAAAGGSAEPSPKALAAAHPLRLLPLAQATGIIDTARMTLWAATFSKDAGSRFAKHVAESIEAAGGDTPRDLH